MLEALTLLSPISCSRLNKKWPDMRKVEYRKEAQPDLRGRQSPYCDAVGAGHLRAWLNLGFRLTESGPTMKPREREVLECWLALIESAPEEAATSGVLDCDQFAELLAARGNTAKEPRYILNTVLKGLHAAGVLDRRDAPNGRPGASYRYSIRSPESLAREWREAEKRPSAPTTSTRNARTASAQDVMRVLEAANLMTTLNTNEPWSYHLITSLLEKCSRSSPKVKLDHIASMFSLAGEMVTAEASRQTTAEDEGPECGLIVADDSQLLLAILTIAIQSIQTEAAQGREPQNQFSVDLADLSTRLNPKRGEPQKAKRDRGAHETYLAFQNGMTRLIRTRFTLRFAPQGEIARMFSAASGQQIDTMSLDLLQDVFEGTNQADVYSPDWAPRKGMRYFTFRLNTFIWEDLRRGRGWVVHQGLLFERSGLTHKIYNHLKAHTSLDHPYRIEGHELMTMTQGVHTARSEERKMRARFCKRLWTLFRAHAKESQGSELQEVVLLQNQPDTPDHDVLNLRFFDLELTVWPDGTHKDAMVIESRLTEESLKMLEKQETRTREALAHIGRNEQKRISGR